MDHQDWKQVVISNPNLKKKNQPVSIVERRDSKQNITKTDADGEVVGVKKVSKSMATELTKGRIAKKLTQIELAKLCNLESKVVGENERGGCIYNAQVWNKFCKVLGVKIERNVD